MLRRPAKCFSTECWHCHPGGTRRPGQSQGLTGPPCSLLIPFRPCPFLPQDSQQPRQPGSEAVRPVDFAFSTRPVGGPGRGVRCVGRRREGLGHGVWDRCSSRGSWVPRGPVMKLAVRGPVPGRLRKGCPLGDSELQGGLSGEAEQRCAPGPPLLVSVAGSFTRNADSQAPTSPPPPAPAQRVRTCILTGAQVVHVTLKLERRSSGPVVRKGRSLAPSSPEMLSG